MKKSHTVISLSTLQNHHTKSEADRLYGPLKKVLINQDIPLYHQIQHPHAAQSSVLSVKFSRLSKGQCLKLNKQLRIYGQQQLVPTNKLQNVNKNKLRIIDVSEKAFKIISNQQLNRIIKENTQIKQIVYVLSQTPKQLTKQRNKSCSRSLKCLAIGNSTSTEKSRQLLSKNISMTNIRQKNKFQSTNKLYDPLRSIIQTPNISVLNEFDSPKAFLFSKLPSNYKRLSFIESLKIEKQTLIPANLSLKPTTNLQNIKNKKFRIINASEKTIGKQLSYQQVQKIIQSRPRDQVIVYEIDEQQQQNQISTISSYSALQKQQIFSKDAETKNPETSSFFSMLASSKKKQQNWSISKKYKKCSVDHDKAINEFNQRVQARIKNKFTENPQVKTLTKCLSSHDLYSGTQQKEQRTQLNPLYFKNTKKNINICIRKKPSFKKTLLRSSKSLKYLSNPSSDKFQAQDQEIQIKQDSKIQLKQQNNLSEKYDKSPINSMISVQKLFILTLPQKGQQQQKKVQQENSLIDGDNIFENTESKLQNNKTQIMQLKDDEKSENGPASDIDACQNSIQQLQEQTGK